MLTRKQAMLTTFLTFGRHQPFDLMFKLRVLLPLSLFCAIALIAHSQCDDFADDDVYFGINNYIEYRPGNMPLIIAVPHGGYLNPPEIADRNCSGCVYTNDAFTLELGQEVYDAITDLTTGCRPHLIINHLDRRKLDGNRAIATAADGDPLAEQAWNDFHGFIADAKACVNASFGKGFFVDLHGHGHTVQRIEYGYLLYEDELALSDETLNTPTYINWSSLRNLATTNTMGLSHAQLLRGTHALGTQLANASYPGVPSQQDPFPLTGQPYFSGGYNTVVHSSYQGGTIDGVQIECNQSIRFNQEARQEFAQQLAADLSNFVALFYTSGNDLCTSLSVSDFKNSAIRLFPNPGSGSFRVSQDRDERHIKAMYVHHIDGRLITELQSTGTIPPIVIEERGVFVVTLVFTNGAHTNLRWINGL